MNSRNLAERPSHCIESMVIEVRGISVILDADLAKVYGVATKRLNEQIRRNTRRFPKDFCFRLSAKEWKDILLRYSHHAVVSKDSIRSQNATASRRNIRFVPYAFTEHGAIMAANVLNSKRAVQMSVFVVRAFIKMRGMLSGNKELALRLAELEKELKKRLDIHETAIVGILQRVIDLIDPPALPEPKKKPVGFRVVNE